MNRPLSRRFDPIDFELGTQDDQPLDENAPALKAMKEAARQLGLRLDEDL
jgi:hypothetical protein